MAARLRLIKFGRALEVRTFAVAPGMRGEGIGARALQDVVEIAHANKAKRIWLASAATAVGFYESNGFTACENSDPTKHVMELELRR